MHLIPPLPLVFSLSSPLLPTLHLSTLRRALFKDWSIFWRMRTTMPSATFRSKDSRRPFPCRTKGNLHLWRLSIFTESMFLNCTVMHYAALYYSVLYRVVLYWIALFFSLTLFIVPLPSLSFHCVALRQVGGFYQGLWRRHAHGMLHPPRPRLPQRKDVQFTVVRSRTTSCNVKYRIIYHKYILCKE